MQMKRFWQFPFSLISTNHMFKLLKKLILFSTILSFSNGFLLETKISSDDTFRLHSNEREAMRNFISGNDFDNIYDRLSAEERYVLFGSDQKNDAPSYQLIRFPHSSYDYHQKRRKRSTLSQSHSNEHTRLEFKAFDRIFRLFLWPNHRLLSPTFHLKHLDNQNDNTWMSREHLTDCFYQGHDEFDPESVAAISVCNGLQGVIETKPTIYIINPIPEITSRRLFGDNTNHSSSKYHLIIKQNTLSNYKCPHDSNKRISNKELDSSTIDSSDLLLTKQNIRKRSIEIDSYQENSLKQEVENSKQSSSDSLGSSSNDIDDNNEIKREENLQSKLERPDLKVTTISSVQKTSSDTNEIIDDEFQSKKTDYSYPFNITVETAVFIDESLYYALSKTFPIETEHQIVLYVLTIMNAVQLLFKQPSIGRSVDISVVLMDLLRQQPKSLTPSDNIDTYLTNFCVWQHKKRLREAGGPTPDWDHALLLSGINMYVVDGQGRRKRHVVGLAPVSGMCNSLNSCTISEGTTFQTVLVAGHEMGHSLGMEHDGSQDGNHCNRDDFVMSPTLGPGKTTWSECSKNYLDKFVLTPQATCVLGRSSHANIIHQFIPPHRLPGERFNADDQCRFRFGQTASHYTSQNKSEICKMIKCFVRSAASKHGFYSGRSLYHYPIKTIFNIHPALEGSECGKDKWCRQGQCVDKIIDSLQTNSKLIENALNFEANHLSSNTSQSKNDEITELTTENNIYSEPTQPHIESTLKPGNSKSKVSDNNVSLTIDSDRSVDDIIKNISTNIKVRNDLAAKTNSSSIDTTNSNQNDSLLIAKFIEKISDNRENNARTSSHRTEPFNSKHYDEDSYNPYNLVYPRVLEANKLTSIDGNWTEWTDYGPCISECVSPGNELARSLIDLEANATPLGVQSSFRTCDNPRPWNGGKECIGADTRIRLCNAIQVCSATYFRKSNRNQTEIVDETDSVVRYRIRTVDEFISDTCTAASKLNDKIENYGTQYPSYDSPSHSCYVWCFKRGGGFLTQGWRLPDGTPCGKAISSSKNQSRNFLKVTGFCYQGQCHDPDCHGRIFLRKKNQISANFYDGNATTFTSMNTFSPQTNHKQDVQDCPDTFTAENLKVLSENDDKTLFSNNFDSTYELVEKVRRNDFNGFNRTTSQSMIVPSDPNRSINRLSTIASVLANKNSSPSYLFSNWSQWHPVTECQYSIACVRGARGFRLITRECQRSTCIGRREALQICQEILVSDHSRPASAMTDFYEQFCPSYSRKNVDEYASAICQKYQIKFSSLLSGRGRQLIGPQNHGCVVSCEDRLWKDVHYQMDAFADGRFPFGTDCSFGNRLGYCLNGKCIHFDQYGISYDTSDSVLHRQEIMQLFAPSTVSSFDFLKESNYQSSHHSLPSSLVQSVPDRSLHSALLTDQLFKQPDENVDQSSIEHQPAYESFISTRRNKRDVTNKSEMFRKASLQEQPDIEQEYLSWTMLRHHRRIEENRGSLGKSSQKNEQKLLKSLRPIKLTSIRRKTNPFRSKPAIDEHFKTFTLVKPIRRKYSWKDTQSKIDSQSQMGTPLANHRTFLDDDVDDDDDDDEDRRNNAKEIVENSNLNRERENRSESLGIGIRKNNPISKMNESINLRRKRPFSLGHESWPSIDFVLNKQHQHHLIESSAEKKHKTMMDGFNAEKPKSLSDNSFLSIPIYGGEDENADNDNDDDDDQSDEYRVEPYVWSVILSDCNKSCGEGIRTIRVVCTVGQKSVDERYCEKESKPSYQSTEPCKKRECIGKWRVEPWSKCLPRSKPCDRDGSKTLQKNLTYQTRTTFCVGPMVIYPQPQNDSPITRNISAMKLHPNLMERLSIRKQNNIVSQSARVFSLLSNDFCDPLLKPIQWRSCQTKYDCD